MEVKKEKDLDGAAVSGTESATGLTVWWLGAAIIFFSPIGPNHHQTHNWPSPEMSLIPGISSTSLQWKIKFASGILVIVPAQSRRAETIGPTRNGARNARGYRSPDGYATVNPTPIPSQLRAVQDFFSFPFFSVCTLGQCLTQKIVTDLKY